MSAAVIPAPPGVEQRARIAAIERLIQEDVGRSMAPLFAAATGGLFAAATTLATHPAPRVGLITGFFVPRGRPPALETDGPVGTALLAAGLCAVGVPCRLATDTVCHQGCAAALDAAGVPEVPIDAAEPGAPPQPQIAAWQAAGITVALAVERCGPGRDGVPRNMRGVDLSAWTAPLHLLFEAGPWLRLAIGDGGNELGMGMLPDGLVARHVALGETIACVTPAQHLIAAGVSNWGCYGLLAALAVLRSDWRRPLREVLTVSRDATILTRLVNAGPAVDGVTGRREYSVDGLPAARHADKITALRALVPP
jgi:hypothetical protein